MRAMELQNSTCGVCGGPGVLRRDFAHRSVAGREIDESVALHECLQCRSAYLYPQPSDAWLANEYKDYYVRRSNNIGDGKSDHFKKVFESHPVTNFHRALEVGGGEGACAKQFLLAAPHADITVIEANRECEPFYKEMGGRCHLRQTSLEQWLSDSSAVSPRHELILCFDVIEHLRNPVATIGSLVQGALEPSGQIWASFPNYDSLSRKLLGKIWPQYKVEHLFYLSREGVARLCERTGLEIVHLGNGRKFLSIGYLFGIGQSFGPKPTRWIFRILSSVIPKALQSMKLSFSLGEWLLIAKRKSHA